MLYEVYNNNHCWYKDFLFDWYFNGRFLDLNYALSIFITVNDQVFHIKINEYSQGLKGQNTVIYSIYTF